MGISVPKYRIGTESDKAIKQSNCISDIPFPSSRIVDGFEYIDFCPKKDRKKKQDHKKVF